MSALTVGNRKFPSLQIPENYQVVTDHLVPRNGQRARLIRYQPTALSTEVLNREHVTVITDLEGKVDSYLAVTEPLTGPLPTEKAAFEKAEKIWQEVNPDYREQLVQMHGLTGLEETYQNAQGEMVTIPIIWAKYANTVHDGSYEWVGFGPTGKLVEFERDNYWDFNTNRQGTEMWYGDDWILARRGLGPQLPSPFPLA